MTADLVPARPDLGMADQMRHLYALIVTVRADNGIVEVQHHRGDTGQLDRDMAVLGAEIVDKLGPPAIVAANPSLHRKRITPGPAITKPAPGQPILACSVCGTAIVGRAIRWQRREYRGGGRAHLARIVCPAHENPT